MVDYSRSVQWITSLAVGIFLGICICHQGLTSYQGYSRLVVFSEERESVSNATIIDLSEGPELWNSAPGVLEYEPFPIAQTDDRWWENFNTNRTLYVHPYTGLANTLQAMASAMAIGYEKNINIKFVFKRGSFGGALWTDIFSFPKVSPNDTFPDGTYENGETKSCNTTNMMQWNHGSKEMTWFRNEAGDEEYACVVTCCWRENPFPLKELWFFRSLRPTQFIQDRIKEFKDSLEWHKYVWIGVHIRRSDNIETMQGLLGFMTREDLKQRVDKTDADTMLPVESYIDVMRKLKNSWPIHHLGPYQVVKPIKFLLATDKSEVKAKLTEEFGENQVIMYEHNLDDSDLRRDIWGMQLAVIEMFLLASCDIVVGTPFSTFSDISALVGGSLYVEPDFAYTNTTSS